MSIREKIEVLGIKISKITEEDCLKLIDSWINSEKEEKHYIVTTNPEFVISAQKDQEFKKIINQSDLSLPDGIGILAAVKYQSISPKGKIIIKTIKDLILGLKIGWSIIFQPEYLNTLPERISGSDLTLKLIEESQKKNWKIFLLGGRNNTAIKTKQILEEKYPGINIAGAFSGNPSPDQDLISRKEINRLSEKIDIILVAYGHPKQEKWIYRNLPQINTRIAIGVGGTFEQIIGLQKRAPLHLQKRGLEWAYRLFKEPWRIKRQTALLKFIFLVWRNKISTY